MRRITFSVCLSVAAGGALVALSAAPAQAQPCFKITDLGALGFTPGSQNVFGVNNNGEAVFTAVVNGKKHAMLYLPADAYGLAAGCHDLHLLAGGQVDPDESSLAHDLNDAGVVIGQATVAGDSLAFVWDLGDVLDNAVQYFDLGTLVIPLGALPFSEAWAVNNENPPSVVGDSHVEGDCFCPDTVDEQCVIRGFIVTLTGNAPLLVELTPVEADDTCDTNSGARDVNTASGPLAAEVAGFSHTRPGCLCTNQTSSACALDGDAMWWQPPGLPIRLVDLSAGGSECRGNNDSDEIVGWGYANPDSPCARRALYWEDEADLVPTTLPTEPAGADAQAEAINNLALPQVVGWNDDTDHALLWKCEGPDCDDPLNWSVTDLNNAIQHCSDTWSLIRAHDLTDAAIPSIVGWGTRSGVNHGFLLTPLPNCCASDLDGSGIVGASDLLLLLEKWGPCADCDECGGAACLGDLDCNCAVGASDLLLLLADWGAECIAGVLTGGGPVPQDVSDCISRYCCEEEDLLALEKCLCSVDPECDPSP